MHLKLVITSQYKIERYDSMVIKQLSVFVENKHGRLAEITKIIANAGRCVLSTDRQKRIHIQSSFVPDMSIMVNNQTDYSNIENVLRVIVIIVLILIWGLLLIFQRLLFFHNSLYYYNVYSLLHGFGRCYPRGGL